MKKIILLFIIASVFLISCGNKKSMNYEDAVYESEEALGSFNSGVVSFKSKANYETPLLTKETSDAFVFADMDIAAERGGAPAKSINNDENYVLNRKLIRNGYLTIEIESFENIDSLINKYVESFNGYITDSNSNERYANYTIKIPCENFSQAMDVSGQLGKVKYRSENAQDVTEEYYDVESRITTKKILKEKFESYLSQSKDIKDLLEVERQLNNVINDLEMYEGRMKRLSNQISYSTISLSFNLPTGFTETGFNWPDLGEDFRKFAENSINFFAGLFMAIFYIVVYGIPVLAIILLLYWLLFGRIGLLIKLFKFLSKKKNK